MFFPYFSSSFVLNKKNTTIRRWFVVCKSTDFACSNRVIEVKSSIKSPNSQHIKITCFDMYRCYANGVIFNGNTDLLGISTERDTRNVNVCLEVNGKKPWGKWRKKKNHVSKKNTLNCCQLSLYMLHTIRLLL